MWTGEDTAKLYPLFVGHAATYIAMPDRSRERSHIITGSYEIISHSSSHTSWRQRIIKAVPHSEMKQIILRYTYKTIVFINTNNVCCL